ncbi:MAG: ACR3 family arsenite efflux transporter [Candidatus Aminicenantes bacterium]|nr:ACR3 family arsenite efflux transporter [Candidatus Aminicenantes bacterium]NIM82938.1 ACR3 family arsenite efflux transporter [Candidatus Aminicenantes bacterium]NIN22315.1 ACR3 family arsenite efflux transporter [Candidatus Aminicenantes bacterium]NIN46083.1 ACR3 family arsenite efflux transporter [Candidatus Aminicenantes bacterium]NIN88919.1 ACR3 family arsenite efflux transporter [Candidatus Aminicenantes bacterium]
MNKKEKRVEHLKKVLTAKNIVRERDLNAAIMTQKENSSVSLEEILLDRGLINQRQFDWIRQMTEIGRLERTLPLVIFIFVVIGVIVGKIFPNLVKAMDSMQIADIVSIPIAVCLFFMMFPIILQVDFSSIKNIFKFSKLVFTSSFIAWIVEPAVMFFLAWFFLKKVFASYFPAAVSSEYMAGIILVGIAPCTAMVLLWSYLARGDLGVTLLLTALNVILILIIYAPIANFLLGKADIHVPFMTIAICVFMYVGISLITGYITRKVLLNKKGKEWYNGKFIPVMKNFSSVALLITLIVIFSSKGELIIEMPATILIIATPILLEFFIIFSLAYIVMKKLKIKYEYAAPASIIAASNHFELGIATAVLMFGINSNPVLATVVVPLIEVPIMLGIVRICLRTRYRFLDGKKKTVNVRPTDGKLSSIGT